LTRQPNDKEPDPPGGRAAERLKDFLKRRGLSEPASSDKQEGGESLDNSKESEEGPRGSEEDENDKRPEKP